MAKAIKGADGKFRGSIGEGKAKVPTAGRPVAAPEAEVEPTPPRRGMANPLTCFSELTLRSEIERVDREMDFFPPGPKGDRAEEYAALQTRLTALMGEAMDRGLVDNDGNLTPPPPRPAFRKPWTHGAKAYPEADTFEALKESMKRKRKPYLVHMTNAGEAGEKPCASCGVPLREPYQVDPDSPKTRVDDNSTWHVDPRSKRAYGQHYYCSWGSLMGRLMKSAPELQ